MRRREYYEYFLPKDLQYLPPEVLDIYPIFPQEEWYR